MEERFWKDGVEYKLVPVKKERKTKALFTLTMPNNNSWNGHWGGEGRCFCKELTAFRYGKAVYPLLKEGNYGYDFGDGWFANVKVTFVTPSEARSAMKKSDGFCGYEWMIDEICKLGEIRPLEERRKQKEYQKRLKEKGIKQLTNEEMEECYRRLKKKGE